MSIAFLVLNHRPQEQLLRLLTTLRRGLPSASICVHNDRFQADVDPVMLREIDNVYLLTNESPMGWGDYSIVDACCRSLEWMNEHLEFDWVVFLSGQDYPIKPLNEFKDYLDAIGADAVVRASPINDLKKAADRRDRRRRYFYQYKMDGVQLRQDSVIGHLLERLQEGGGVLIDAVNIAQPFFKIYRMPHRVPYPFGWRAFSSPFAPDYPCWHGSMWMSLSRKASEFVVDTLKKRPCYVQYFRRTIIPDESAIVTLVCNSSELRVENRQLHYIRWSNWQKGSPDVFTALDFDELHAAQGYFARKFDVAKDVTILDRLDEVIK